MLNLESLSIPTSDTPTHTYDSPTHTYKHIEVQEKMDSPEKTYTQENVYTIENFHTKNKDTTKQSEAEENSNKQETKTAKPVAIIKDLNPIDLIPKIVKLPNTWNLDNMELKLDLKMNGYKDNRVISPDETLESEWEFV